MSTFAERLVLSKNMIAGLTAHVDQVTQRGFTAEVLSQMSALYEKAIALNNQRNALKARSQEATSEAETLLSELESLCGDAKKIVRMDFGEETWPEFGFRKGEYTSKVVVTTEKSKA